MGGGDWLIFVDEDCFCFVVVEDDGGSRCWVVGGGMVDEGGLVDDGGLMEKVASSFAILIETMERLEDFLVEEVALVLAEVAAWLS